MQQSNKDPAIKLFGKEIPLQENLVVPGIEEETETGKVKDTRQEQATEATKQGEKKSKTPCINGETEKLKEGSESPASRPDKTLKKPDKILPCPRCKSMDTKFCYYNNYNVNQPRHFCKACQRYWTAGGSMRNVPVGAGRRKSKNSSLPHNGLIIAPNARMLSFNLDSPIFEYSSSVLNLEEEKGTRNGDDCSSATSIRFSNLRGKKGRRKLSILENNVNGLPLQIHCLAGVPYCPYPGVPMSLYPVPTAYWNCPVSGVPSCPTLGKRSRDGWDMEQDEASKQNKSENGCVLVPKTLRIDDPREAAKSSIWATLGIKNESMSEGGMFKAIQSKGGEKKNDHLVETSPVLMANPAALSRSLNFHETS